MSISYEVLYVLATRIRFMCPMNFNRFPMDEQTCKFQVRFKIKCAQSGLNGHSTVDLNFRGLFISLIFFKVGSFNYDNTKMVYNTYFLPKLPNSTDPILDYDVSTKLEFASKILDP